MERKYKILKNQKFSHGNYQIVPIRDRDKYPIMKWRNEQIYHLRQNEILTSAQQEKYFQEVISDLFVHEQPGQILFSYLENGKCIGYGGLVHINWSKKAAEVSFIMETKLENENFEKHWTQFLSLLYKVAFDELNFHKIFTYAYDLRSHLYPVLEKNGFIKTREFFNQHGEKIVIHEKYHPQIQLREAMQQDIDLLFAWSNDKEVRMQSYKTEPIGWEEHKIWFATKMADKNSQFYILNLYNQPAGWVRFNLINGYSIIGVLVARPFRGKGLSDIFINLSVQKYWKNHPVDIYAYIKKNNKASIKSFEKAGFVLKKDLIIENVPSYLYVKSVFK